MVRGRGGRGGRDGERERGKERYESERGMGGRKVTYFVRS